MEDKLIENRQSVGQKYLVTGAGGYLGSEVVKTLLAAGQSVRAMVRDRSAAQALRGLDVEIVEGDLRDMPSLKRAAAGIKGVHHIASIFRQANQTEEYFYDVNAEGTRRLLEASIEAGVSRFIHCSTGGVLGHIANPPGNENSPHNPGDMYQRSKLEGEKIALEYFQAERIKGLVIRPAMIYGPGDTRNLKLFRMIAKRRFFYVGKGRASVHFVDVRDLAKAFLLAMEKEHLNGGIYHIAGSRAAPLKEMVEIICRELGVPRPWLHLPVKPMQVLGSVCEAVCVPLKIQPPIFRRRVDFFTKDRNFDCSKAVKELGYAPAKSFEEEIKETIGWYRQQGWI
jgi:nucleoside-diphosphate-sugar epimerase